MVSTGGGGLAALMRGRLRSCVAAHLEAVLGRDASSSAFTGAILDTSVDLVLRSIEDREPWSHQTAVHRFGVRHHAGSNLLLSGDDAPLREAVLDLGETASLDHRDHPGNSAGVVLHLALALMDVHRAARECSLLDLPPATTRSRPALGELDRRRSFTVLLRGGPERISRSIPIELERIFGEEAKPTSPPAIDPRDAYGIRGRAGNDVAGTPPVLLRDEAGKPSRPPLH